MDDSKLKANLAANLKAKAAGGMDDRSMVFVSFCGGKGEGVSVCRGLSLTK